MAIKQLFSELALPLAAIVLGLAVPALTLVAVYGWW
jgi:multisubunit Na+/H+ antiporter MnhC subunit